MEEWQADGVTEGRGNQHKPVTTSCLLAGLALEHACKCPHTCARGAGSRQDGNSPMKNEMNER